MLFTSEYKRARQARAIAAVPRQSQMVFPFSGALIAGYFSPPFAGKYVEQIMGTAYACLNLRSRQIANLQWLGYKITGQDTQTLLENEHWLVRLLQSPSRYRTPGETWSLIDQWLSVTGNAYILVQRDPRTGLPAELWPLESNNVTAVPSKGDSFIAGYRYTTPRGVFTYQPEDIWHIRLASPTTSFTTNLYFGVSEFSKFSNVIDTEQAALLYQARYFNNDATPNFTIKQPAGEEGASQQQIKEFREQWDENRAGAYNAGRYAVLPPGWELDPIQSGGREVDFLKTMDSLREYIATCLGVPLVMLNGEYNARATAETVTDYFIKNTIYPRAKLIAESLTQFAQLYEADVKIGFNDIVHESVDETVQKVESLAKIGGITPNEARQLYFKADPLPSGDAPLVPDNLVRANN